MSNCIDMAVILQKPILTAQEAALFLGVSVSNLYKKTMSKDIPHYKPEGKLLYFNRLELEAWMQRNRVKTNDEAFEEAQSYIVLGRKGSKQ